MTEKLLSDFFKAENIKYYACVPIGKCELLYPRKLPEYTKSVCFFLIPYYYCDVQSKRKNVSLYATPRDYHLYVKELSERLEILKNKSGLEVSFRIFADNSPFAERSCAQKACLGKIAKNGLLVNPEYGTYSFIGSICFSSNISISHCAENFNSDLCENCEKCKKSCPFVRGKCGECLSNITQKKKITPSEAELIAEFPIKWGCDICQRVCPYNKEILQTPIEFFQKNRIAYVTPEIINEMSEEEFGQRAYSWRGKEVILRNLSLK